MCWHLMRICQTQMGKRERGNKDDEDVYIDQAQCYLVSMTCWFLKDDNVMKGTWSMCHCIEEGQSSRIHPSWKHHEFKYVRWKHHLYLIHISEFWKWVLKFAIFVFFSEGTYLQVILLLPCKACEWEVRWLVIFMFLLFLSDAYCRQPLYLYTTKLPARARYSAPAAMRRAHILQSAMGKLYSAVCNVQNGFCIFLPHSLWFLSGDNDNMMREEKCDLARRDQTMAFP